MPSSELILTKKTHLDMETIRQLRELTTDLQALAGGKGGTLARLSQLGFPVPDGFVILPAAFEGDKLTPESWIQVREQLNRLRKEYPGASFAVRSSALAEDSVRASFAGEFETVLGVCEDGEIREAILIVRRSRMSERVQAYSQAKGIGADHEIAVVVQILIPAEFSGILFTVDPITGGRKTMTGSFVRGLGDKLVSGKATGEAFMFERPAGKYQGPAELKRYEGKLFGLALRAEEELGHPQDIEWVVKNGTFFIVQSRPITTMNSYQPAAGEWNDSLTGEYLWSNVNFGEAVTKVMTPLSWTVLKQVFGEWTITPGYDAVGNIGGRPYLNISLYASLLRALGRSHEDVLEALEATLYMKLPEGVDIPLVPLSRRYLLSALPALMRTRLKERKGVKNLPAYLASNPAWFLKMRAEIQAVGTATELSELWRSELYPHVVDGLWIVMGSVQSSTSRTMKLRRKLNQMMGPDDANVLISNLSDESGLLASLGPVVGIARVARGEMDSETYLALCGHRGADEFELSVPRPSEKPHWVDEQLAKYGDSPVDVEALLAKQREEFEAAWERFLTRYPGKSNSMRRRIQDAAHRARMREAARSEYIRDRWLVRIFALRAAEMTGLEDDIFFLTLDELLDALDGDASGAQAIPGRKELYERYRALPPYPSIILGRFDSFRWATDPERRSDIFTPNASLSKTEDQISDARIITGSPGSAGRVEAYVRRLDRPDDGDQLREGEVLVTAQTDIAWTLLFPRSAAIVTDVGAPLSHAAIVARELGIPAVVGCRDATMRLSTGDKVRVDGGQGTVEILDS